MLSFSEARLRVLGLASRLGIERVGLDDACGRVLSSPVVAPGDRPAFDYSAMDGYAVCSADWREAGALRLPVRGESRAGSDPRVLAPGSACRIFTGARVPEGADAVVMQEQVERDGETAVFSSPPAPGAHIRRRGEDLAAGAIALTAGTRLRPAHVALAASCDLAWLEVGRRPVVAILGTGDELRAPGATASGSASSIPESNGPAVRAMAARAGAIARVLPSARDDRAVLARTFEAALRGADLLVTIGGVSVGDHDLVRPVLEELGVRVDFWKVAMKPGKPLLVGRRDATVVLGLPGNPVSAMVTFGLFGVPLLRAMQGDAAPLPDAASAVVGEAVAHAPGRTEFLRAEARWDGGELRASPVSNQASGAPVSMARADGLLWIEAERGCVEAGERAPLLWLDDLCA